MLCWVQMRCASPFVRCGIPSRTKNSRQVGGGGQNCHSPSVSSNPCSSLSFQHRVRAICDGETSSGSSFRSTTDFASLMNVAVSRPPVPLRKPRRESITNPPSCTRIWGRAERPIVAHLSHIVVPPLPVKAGWRGRSPLWMQMDKW